MRRFLKATWLMVILSLVVLAGSLLGDFKQGDVYWTQKAGGPITVFGIIAGARALLKTSIKERVRKPRVVGAGNAKTEYTPGLREKARDLRGQVVGLILALFGALIGSYSDVIYALVCA